MRIYTEYEIKKKLNKKKHIAKIFKSIFYPIIIVILLSNLWLVIQKLKEPNKIPNLFGYKAFSILSGSMEPTLHIGDMIIIKETNSEELKTNDIITFMEEGSAVTHRIVEIVYEDGKISYKTKGDANNANDSELVKAENIQGKYVGKIGKIGGLITKAKNTTTLVIIVIIIYFVYSIISKRDDRRIARHEKRREFEERNKKT